MLRGVLLIVAACIASQVASQAYPNKPVRIVVPFAPAGSTDVTARLLAEELSNSFKQTFVVENKPGAAGTAGIDFVAKSRPDGYTLGLSGVGPTAIIPMIDPSLPYQPSRDLDTVGYLSSIDLVLVARPDFPANSLLEALAYATSKPEKVSYGSTGVAGPVHIAFEYLSKLAGVKLLHIPYAGDSQMLTALLSGEVDIGYLTVAGGLSQIQSGKVKAFAVGGPKRTPSLPNLPTVAEVTGHSEYDAYTWNVLVAAKGTPPEILQKLNAAVEQALRKPEVRARMDQLGLIPTGGDVNTAAQFVAGEIEKYKRIIPLTGVKRQ